MWHVSQHRLHGAAAQPCTDRVGSSSQWHRCTIPCCQCTVTLILAPSVDAMTPAESVGQTRQVSAGRGLSVVHLLIQRATKQEIRQDRLMRATRSYTAVPRLEEQRLIISRVTELPSSQLRLETVSHPCHNWEVLIPWPPESLPAKK